jgi:hypothetical protein
VSSHATGFVEQRWQGKTKSVFVIDFSRLVIGERYVVFFNRLRESSSLCASLYVTFWFKQKTEGKEKKLEPSDRTPSAKSDGQKGLDVIESWAIGLAI